MSCTLLRRIRLSKTRHKPTGRTHHYHGDFELPVPNELRIVQYDSDPGFYLLYLDEVGNELTDTYHESLAEALRQAKWEFEVGLHEWEVVDSGA